VEQGFSPAAELKTNPASAAEVPHKQKMPPEWRSLSGFLFFACPAGLV